MTATRFSEMTRPVKDEWMAKAEFETTNLSDAPEAPTRVSSASERRSFFGVIIGLITSGIAATLGLAIERFIFGPALTASNSEEKNA